MAPWEGHNFTVANGLQAAMMCGSILGVGHGPGVVFTMYEDRVSQSTTSSDSDSLILVDEADREVGHLDKARCHEGQGVLHRAFSLLIFNDAGELLLQQRSATKRSLTRPSVTTT